MSDFRNLCWGAALASILLVAAPARAAGESPSSEGYAASELMQTAQSDLGVHTALAMGKVARDSHGPAETAQTLGAAYEKELTWDAARGTLIQDDHVPTARAALAMLAMTNDKDKLAHQADFLLAHQEPDGGIANGFTMKRHKVLADKEPRTLLTQAAAIRGWVAAWNTTQDPRYQKAAERAYLFIERSLWSKEAHVYKASTRAKQTTYDPMLLGTVVGALRDLAASHDGATRAEFAHRLDGVWQAVARQGNPLAGVTFATRS